MFIYWNVKISKCRAKVGLGFYLILMMKAGKDEKLVDLAWLLATVSWVKNGKRKKMMKPKATYSFSHRYIAMVMPSQKNINNWCMFFGLSQVARQWSISLSTPSMAKIKHRMMVLSAWEVWRATCTHQIIMSFSISLCTLLSVSVFILFASTFGWIGSVQSLFCLVLYMYRTLYYVVGN